MSAAGSKFRVSNSRLFWRVFTLVAFLPLIWGLAVPWFLHLDPIAFEAIRNSSTVVGVIATLSAVMITALRLNRPMNGAFPYRTARDLTGLILFATMARWFSHLGSLEVPGVESFAVLSCHIGSGLCLAVVVYFVGRRTLRRNMRTRDPQHLPGLRSVMTLNAGAICLIVALLLGVGLTARSAGRLDSVQSHVVADLANRIAAELRLAKTTAMESKILRVWKRTDYVHPEIVPSGERPSWLRNALSFKTTKYGFFVLSRLGQRWHLTKRNLKGRHLWLAAAANVRPPVRAPDLALSLVILVALLFGSPFATWLASVELKGELTTITDGLNRLGQARSPAVDGSSQGLADSIALPGVPIPSNDEAGDLAGHLNEACRLFARTNQDLVRELRLAARSNAAQNIFLRSASVELQHPLDHIDRLCHSLLETEMTDDQVDDVKVIEKAGRQLSDHVGEILKLSELDEWQEVPLELSWFDINELARDVMTRLADRAKPGLIAEIAFADDVPQIRADRKRIDQVLGNLIENAFKYTPSGYVRVTTINDRLEDGRPAIHVQVWDSGPGIPESEQSAIFSEFYRVADQRDIPGTGLGLAIALRLVERHDGRLWVESIEGEGCTFHLVLPIAPEAGHGT